MLENLLFCSDRSDSFCLEISKKISKTTKKVTHVSIFDSQEEIKNVTHKNILKLEVNKLSEKKQKKLKTGKLQLDPVKCLVDNIINEIQESKTKTVFLNCSLFVTNLLISKIREIYKKDNKDFQIHTVCHLNSKYPRFDILYSVLDQSDQLYLLSNYWKVHLLNEYAFTNEVLEKLKQNTHILNHGVNFESFQIKNRIKCREELGLPEDGFLILNTNRNHSSKGLDISIEAFVIMLKSLNFDSRLYLVLNCEKAQQNGYYLEDVIYSLLEKHKVPLQLKDKIINLENKRTEEDLCNLYNACDVGLNTCFNEFFGLHNLEHALLNKPQVISGVGSLVDVYHPLSTIVNPVITVKSPLNFDITGGEMSICRPIDFAQKMVDIYDNYEEFKQEIIKKHEYLFIKHDWDNSLEILEFKENPQEEDSDSSDSESELD
jgi:glycosyltransferase involved in cell wall biosynthesis